MGVAYLFFLKGLFVILGKSTPFSCSFAIFSPLFTLFTKKEKEAKRKKLLLWIVVLYDFSI